MDEKALLLVRALVGELKVHLIGDGFYLVSNEIQALDEAATARLRLRAVLASEGNLKPRDVRRAMGVVRAILRQLGLGSVAEYRDPSTKQHTRKFFLADASLATLQQLEDLGAEIVSQGRQGLTVYSDKG